MLKSLRLILSVSALAAVAVQPMLVTTAPALAQRGGGPTAGDDQGAPAQIPLTQAMIDNFLASQSGMSAAQGNAQSDQPDPRVQKKMEAVAKKNGFTGLDQFGAVADSVGMVMAGMDPETKSYVGPEAVLKKQIAQVQSDKSMPARDKAGALKELKEAMAAGGGPKPPSGNIDLVSKNFDKLSQAFQQGGGGGQ